MAAGDRIQEPSNRSALFWTIVAVILGLSVLAINRGPLYYFDSAGYYLQGNGILSFILPDAAPEAAPETDAGTAATGAETAPAADEEDDSVTISRSPVYALLIAVLWNTGLLSIANLLNLVAVFVASLLLARAVSRNASPALATMTLTSAPIAVAALSSLPFYIAYVMPDTFIGIAILLAAAMAAFSQHLRPWEILLAFLLLAFALIVHRSHLLIILLLVPFCVIGAIIAAGRRGWIAAGLMSLAVAVGFAEIKSYSFAAQEVAGQNVTMPPFLTARSIEDGPGYDYLQENCPEIGIDTCALAEALSWSDDPWRLTASHIAFETSERLGSFKLMTPENQRLVSAEQHEFYLRVFKEYPFRVIWAILRNTYVQMTKVSIHMTVPDDTTMNMVRRTTEDPDINFGVLPMNRGWIDDVNRAHVVMYGISTLAILALLVLPRRSTRQMRVFALLVVVGILINAFVCGAVSQPASRYGARVAWLLPFLATLMALAAFAPRLSRQEDHPSTQARPEPAE